jgi:hypothetical protein
MSKKKRFRKIFESTSIESADANPRLTKSEDAEQGAESDLASTQPEEGTEAADHVEETAGQESLPPAVTEGETTESTSGDQPGDSLAASSEEENAGLSPVDETSSGESPLSQTEAGDTSSDDLLEDVRRSLIEEETSKEQKESKWWRRFGRKSKSAEPEQPPASMEIDLPQMPAYEDETEVQEQKSESDEELLDELIDALKTETEEESALPQPAPEVVSEVASEPEPEPEIDFEQLKEQALGPRPAEEEPEELSNVRSIALEGDEEVFVEVQPQVSDPLEERLKGFENALRPYRSYIYTALALLGVAMAVFASLIIYNVYKQSTAKPVAEVPNLPYPTSVSLPGGWSFKLGRGSLQDGKWEPQGAEWLQGTEVCRWVALPWSRQLEAVVRTLNPKDPIELGMSNDDQLTYKVYSVRQLTPEEMQKLDSNSPCLLLILTQTDTEKRWVLTALP